MGPLVIKERFKQTRVYSCGDSERHGVTKGSGREAQITSHRIRFVKEKQTTDRYIYQQMKKKELEHNLIFQVPEAAKHK